jgi:WD40 repeat protein
MGIPIEATAIVPPSEAVPADAAAMSPDEASDDAATLPPRGTMTRAAAVTQHMGQAAAPRAWAILPGYEILGELGRGGMGVVYKARQIKLNRVVALKMILTGAHSSEEDLARFRTEAEAIAMLQHPNIIQVFEVGEQEGTPYFVLEYCPGGSLDAKLAGTPLPPGEAAGLVQLLARAMDAAHARGVVHRDLKPANILLTFSREPPAGADSSLGGGARLNDSVPKITDFGLAKKLDTPGLTGTGTILGTPSYMAPEQAAENRGQTAPAVDIYALGSILYEMLTGRPPFRAARPLDTVMQVISEEPVPPRRLQPKLGRDLETICLKCLHKQPGRRYATAGDLADDLGRFLAGEPIQARPVGVLERAVKWTRRRPAAAALLALSILAVISATVAGFWFTAELRWERDLAQDARGRAETEKLQVESTLVELYTASGLIASDRGALAQAALWFASAVELAPDETALVRANRKRFAVWTRELPVPVRAMADTGTGEIVHFLPHPGGRHLLTERIGTGWRLWDLDSERSLTLPTLDGGLSAAAWSPDGHTLALGTDRGRCSLLSFPDLHSLDTITFDGPVSELSFAANGRWLALGGRTVCIWDGREKRFHTPPYELPGTVAGLAFSPDARRLAVAWSDLAQVLNLPDGDNPGPLVAAFAPVLNARLEYNARSHLVPVWVDAGRTLLTYEGKGVLAWNGAMSGKARRLPTKLEAIDMVIAHPAGRLIAVSGWRGAQLYDTATGVAVGPLLQDTSRVGYAAFTADGKTLVTGNNKRSAQMWSVPDGREIGHAMPHTGEVWGVALIRGGLITTCGRGDGQTRVWRVPVSTSHGFSFPVPEFRFGDRSLLSPDGRYVVAWPEPKAARVLDAVTGQPAGPVLKVGEPFRSCTFADGDRLLILTPTALQGWDWRSGKPGFEPVTTPSAAYSVTVSPDRRRAVVMCEEQGLMVDTASGKVIFTVFRGSVAKPLWYHPRARFSPDGSSFVTFPWPGVTVWETNTGRRRFPPLNQDGITLDVRFSADGKLLATGSGAAGSGDNTARVWEADSGKMLATFKHLYWVSAVGFSGDGRYLIAASRDGEVRIRDWRADRLVCRPLSHADEAWAAVFLPGNDMVLTASLDKTVRIWNVKTGKLLAPALELPEGAERAELTPGGSRVVLDLRKGQAMVFDLKGLLDVEIDNMDPTTQRLLGEVNAAQWIFEGGGVVNLNPDEWLERWRRLRQLRPKLHTMPASE